MAPARVTTSSRTSSLPPYAWARRTAALILKTRNTRSMGLIATMSAQPQSRTK